MYTRRILLHGPDPEGTPVLLSDRAIAGCWFELLRQGGCGAGSLLLHDGFASRHAIDIGDWISFEYSAGVRWYLGRVEERRATSPARIQLRLSGMSIELGQVFPGGFGTQADGAPPHRYAATDLFINDPDRADETADSVAAVNELVVLLLLQYVTPQTHITYDPVLVESAPRYAPLVSLKLRGEESVRSVLKDLAVRAGGMSWGVDAFGTFFFLRPRDEVVLTLRDGDNLTSLDETRDSEFLFNRLLLTGDYVYDVIESSGQIARRSYRWRGNFFEPDSRAAHGDRRLRLWIPWIRTQEDAVAFSREFFRTYAQPTSRYLLETTPQVDLPIPWLGRVRLEDREGGELTTARVQSIRVRFDHAPVFRMELGPDDPRELWPEPPHDERWERPEAVVPVGGEVSLTSLDDGGGGGSSETSDASETASAPVSLSSGSSVSSDSSDASDGSDGSSDQSESMTASDDETSLSEPASSLTTSPESSLLSAGTTTDPSSGATSSSGTTAVSSLWSTSDASDSGVSSDSDPGSDGSDSLASEGGSSDVSSGDSEASGASSDGGADSGSDGETASNPAASSGSGQDSSDNRSDELSFTDSNDAGSLSEGLSGSGSEASEPESEESSIG